MMEEEEENGEKAAATSYLLTSQHLNYIKEQGSDAISNFSLQERNWILSYIMYQLD